ncbi:MAG: PQQ-binding-like beta-propeller repeat protein, partial [Gammaproteobacteria bacterium]|nr:PQQ-binding-like beta-propeller repeat protein [Gammaproteobacteria bacterium]
MITRIPHKLAILAFFLIGSISVQAQDQDWPSYGGDNGSRKYSPLDQINADNVDQLEAAWTWTSVDNATVAQNIADENFRAMPAGFKATPIVVDGVMYIPTSYGRIAAIDAATGEEKWVFDTTAWETGRPPNLGYNSRGVGYWEKGNKKRVFFATNDAVLWSIDVTTGQPDADFGEGGRVDLTQGLGREIDRRQ